MNLWIIKLLKLTIDLLCKLLLLHVVLHILISHSTSKPTGSDLEEKKKQKLKGRPPATR